ncbi:MAG TPA: Fe-only nitrogenase accessory protein AnfO [Clostridia bacterium]
MNSIATLLNQEGFTSSINEEGAIKVYSKNLCTEPWEVSNEFPFSIAGVSSIQALRSKLSDMVQKIGDTKIFVASEVAGQLYNVLEANGFNVYEVDGRPEQFLDSIITMEEESKSEAVKNTQTIKIPEPKMTDIEGEYFIDLGAALNMDPSITSKRILLPFLTKKDYKKLEILCDHIPRWFDEEFEKRCLTSNITKLERSGYMVIVSR